jgi:hypothetical protein
MKEVSKSIRLLRVIQTPFTSTREMPNVEETRALFSHAIRNKIELLYLSALKGIEGPDWLLGIYDSSMQRYHTFLESMERAMRIMTGNGLPCMVFKSLMPTPTLLNDVDILLMNPRANVRSALKIMLANGYQCVSDMSPLKVTVHDLRGGEHFKGNDPYDIDIYSEIRANRFIYLDKIKLNKWAEQRRILDEEVTSLAEPADLIVQIVHSYFEHLYTLHHYYSILNSFSKRDEGILVDIARENNALYALKVALTITASLHEAAHGNIPRNLSNVLAELPEFPAVFHHSTNTIYETPYRYGLDSLAMVIFEKLREDKARKSLLMQFTHMLNPKLTSYLIWHFIFRRRRETY